MGTRGDAILRILSKETVPLTAKEITTKLVQDSVSDRWEFVYLTAKTRDCLRKMERYGLVTADRSEFRTLWRYVG